jgi:hypothetical protein
MMKIQRWDLPSVRNLANAEPNDLRSLSTHRKNILCNLSFRKLKRDIEIWPFDSNRLIAVRPQIGRRQDVLFQIESVQTTD